MFCTRALIKKRYYLNIHIQINIFLFCYFLFIFNLFVCLNRHVLPPAGTPALLLGQQIIVLPAVSRKNKSCAIYIKLNTYVNHRELENERVSSDSTATVIITVTVNKALQSMLFFDSLWLFLRARLFTFFHTRTHSRAHFVTIAFAIARTRTRPRKHTEIPRSNWLRVLAKTLWVCEYFHTL